MVGTRLVSKDASGVSVLGVVTGPESIQIQRIQHIPPAK